MRRRSMMPISQAAQHWAWPALFSPSPVCHSSGIAYPKCHLPTRSQEPKWRILVLSNTCAVPGWLSLTFAIRWAWMLASRPRRALHRLRSTAETRDRLVARDRTLSDPCHGLTFSDANPLATPPPWAAAPVVKADYALLTLSQQWFRVRYHCFHGSASSG